MGEAEGHNQDQAELQQLVDAVPQHIVVLTGDGRRLYGNQAACDYHGLTRDQFLVEPITNCFHPQDIETYSRIRNAGIATGNPWEAEARLRRQDGSYRWFLIRGKALRNAQGSVVRWYLTRTDIEDRKQAERELQQLVDAVPQHIVVISPDGRRLYPNRVTLDFFGWTLDDFSDDQKVRQSFHRDDLSRFYEERQRGISLGVPFEIEARILRKDGHYRWFLFLYNPYRNTEGQIVAWYSTGTDIEDRKQAVWALQHTKDRLRLLLDFTNNLVTKLDLRGLLRALVSSVRKIIACDLVAVFLPAFEPHFLRIFVVDFASGLGLSDEESKSGTAQGLVPIDETLAGRVFRTGKVWTGTDHGLLELGLTKDPGIPKGLKAGCVLPILCCDSVLGVLALARRNENPFGRQEIELLQQVGDQVAVAIVNALAVEDRKRAEDALGRSEAYLAEAQRLSHTGSWAWDYHKKEIMHWSPETYRVFGFDPARGPVSWEQARSRIHPEDLESFDKNKERVATERIELEFDFRMVLPDGNVKHAHCVSRPVINASGELVELVGSIMDVTEQFHSRNALEKAFEEIKLLKDELYRENLALKEEIDQASMFEEIVGTSVPLRRVLAQVAKVAPADSTVLITGETGTGKELIARAIHKRSKRSAKAFVSVNCAAIPQSLIGSELFGHEKGAFTGASQRRLGRFELANGGTLFLDEVGDLPPETQIALLRVLQEQQFERIGGTNPISVDVRIIAATNRDLKALVNAGTFRSDLFYRLNVFPIAVPPLRERKDDIPLLVQYLTERFASKAGKKIKNIHKKTLELFEAYDWPGNIRELQNVVERAVILCDGETFSVDESWLQPESPHPGLASDSLARPGAERERELIETALAETKGRIAGPMGAAAKLGIPRSTLETKIRKLGIKKHRFNTT